MSPVGRLPQAKRPSLIVLLVERLRHRQIPRGHAFRLLTSAFNRARTDAGDKLFFEWQVKSQHKRARWGPH